MTERTSRMLSDLDARARPQFYPMFERLDKALGESQYMVWEGRRSKQVQEAYYAQGRQSLSHVNVLRSRAGLYLLRGDKDNYIITKTLKSKHIDGLAMDVLPVDGKGRATWDYAHYRRFFVIIVESGRAAGLECGADWQDFPDWPHYEIKGEV